MDMLQTQLAGVTLNGSANEDGSCNSVENVSDPNRQDLNSVSHTEGREAARESTADDFDSTESFTSKLPSPPSGSPGAAVNDSGLCSAVSTGTDVVDSISSRASLDSYIWSSANSDLPSWSLPDDEEILIWPSKVLVYSKH